MHEPIHGEAIGYKRPPKATQFQKGQSGNPRGRPRGSKNLSTLISEALDEKLGAFAVWASRI